MTVRRWFKGKVIIFRCYLYTNLDTKEGTSSVPRRLLYWKWWLCHWNVSMLQWKCLLTNFLSFGVVYWVSLLISYWPKLFKKYVLFDIIKTLGRFLVADELLSSQISINPYYICVHYCVYIETTSNKCLWFFKQWNMKIQSRNEISFSFARYQIDN